MKTSLRRNHVPGRKPEPILWVNQYQTDLEAIYDRWAHHVSNVLGSEKAIQGRQILQDIAVLLLIDDLSTLGKRRLPQSIRAAGLRGVDVGDSLRTFLANQVLQNSITLEKSLLPDVRLRLRGLSQDSNPEAVYDSLVGMKSRVGQYAGTYWKILNRAIGERGGPVVWTLDSSSTHCRTCLEYGGRAYVSFEAMLATTNGVWPAGGTDCGGVCRCLLTSK